MLRKMKESGGLEDMLSVLFGTLRIGLLYLMVYVIA